MIKQYGYKLAILGCVSTCLLNVAQAEVVLAGDPPHEDDDVVFQSVPEVSNFACVAAGSPSDNVSSVDYVLQNNLPSTVSLYGIQLNQEADDDSGVTATLAKTGCVSSYSDVNGGSGTIDPWGTCTLTVQFTPPACAGTTGPLGGNIDQSLFIGVDTQQGELTLDISGEVNVIGAGGQFALLGGFYDDPTITDPTQPYVVLNQDGYANSVAVGSVANLAENVGPPASPDTTGFSIYDGTAYYQDETNTAVNTAETNFEQAYSALIQVLTNNTVSFKPLASSHYMTTPPTVNCTWDSSLDDGDAVTPGYYCLQSYNSEAEGFTDVSLSGTIYLQGSGNFYFFIDPFNDHCVDDDSNSKMCDLIVQSTLRFEYSDGASPENVYWITTGNIGGSFDPTTPTLPTAADFSQVELKNGAILDGTILAGGQINVPVTVDTVTTDVYYGYSSIVADTSGNRATIVNGSLWAPMGNSTTELSIALSGSTVNAADYVTAELVAAQRAARDEELAIK